MKRKKERNFIIVILVIIIGVLSLHILRVEDSHYHTEIEIIIDKTDYDLAVQKIKEGEGLRLKPYILDCGMYIGYGHKISDKNLIITESQADSLLQGILFKKIKYVNREYGFYGNKALSLGMLYYTCKPSSIKKSKLHKQLKSNQPDNEIIRESWESFCYFNGKENKRMKERRKFEVDLFFKH